MNELGRRHAPDERDLQYMLEEVLPLPPLETLPRYRYHYEPVNVDQTGPTCVANAHLHALCDGPAVHQLAALDAQHPGYRSAYSGQTGWRGYVYDQAQQIDEWPDTPPEGGTSIRAGYKVLQQLKHYREYRWLDGVAQVAAAIYLYSPVVIGIPWFESDMNVSTGDWIRGEGEMVGGHAVCLDGVNRTGVGKVRVQTWGLRLWMTFPVLARLLSEDGEAGVGVE